MSYRFSIRVSKVPAFARMLLFSQRASRGQGPEIAFISISGGALGPNPKLADDLTKRIGKKPVTVIDLHIADLLPSDPKPTRQNTSAYRLNEQDILNLTGKSVKEVHKIEVE